MSRWAAVLVVLVGTFTSLAAAEGKEPSDVESRALRALGDGDAAALADLATEVGRLDVDMRRRLPLRIRADAIEFRFRGEYPGGEFNPEMFEYAICRVKEKEYESLLAVQRDEFARLQKLGEALARLAKSGRKPALDVRFVWTEGGRTQVERLHDVLRLETPARRDEFLHSLAVIESGLGTTTNLKADPATLPSKRIPAEVHVGVRLPASEPAPAARPADVSVERALEWLKQQQKPGTADMTSLGLMSLQLREPLLLVVRARNDGSLESVVVREEDEVTVRTLTALRRYLRRLAVDRAGADTLRVQVSPSLNVDAARDLISLLREVGYAKVELSATRSEK